MSHRHPDEHDERLVTKVDAYRTTVRFVMDVGLLVALVGVAVPFGLHDLRGYDVNGYEIALSVLAALAALGVLLDLVRRPIWPWPYALACFVWGAAAAYAAMLPEAVVGARISLALVFAGYAVASAGAWRIAVMFTGREL